MKTNKISACSPCERQFANRIDRLNKDSKAPTAAQHAKKQGEIAAVFVATTRKKP